MNANPHILDAEQLRKLSGKRSAASVRKWANRHGIRTLDGADGPWTTQEAIEWAKRKAAPAAIDPVDYLHHTQRDILAASIPFGERLPSFDCHDPCGIYFLINGSAIVYVGKSIHITARINQHYYAERRFERVWYFTVPSVHLASVEAFYIHAIKPAWNVQYPPLASRFKREGCA